MGRWKIPFELPHKVAHRALICGVVLLVLPALRPTPLFSAIDSEQITEAIRNLSHHSFSVRTRAERTLRNIGMAAQDQLINALDHADVETQRAARRILQQVLRDRLRHQVRQFTMQGPRAADPALPGWAFYRNHVGDDPIARSDFVAAVLAEPVLLESLQQDPAYRGQALQSRTQTLYDVLIRNPGRDPSARQGPGTSSVTSIASVSALLIVAADDSTPLEDQTAQKIFQLMQHAGVTQGLNADGESATRRLVGHFVRRSSGTPLAYQMLWLSMQCNLPEGLIPAEAILQEKTPQPYILQNAMLAIAKLGNEQHLALLEPFLEVETPINNRRNSGFQPLVQDVALAASIHLHGKNPKEFGFAQLRTNTHTLFQAGSIGFNNPKERKAAFRRWNQLRGDPGGTKADPSKR